LQDAVPHTRTRRDRSPFDCYLTEINQTPLLTADEEQELARRIAQGDAVARDRLIRANLRLVVAVARTYAGKCLPLEDLIAEGNLGLVRAAEGFDADAGTRFSTYATYWVKQSIRSALRRDGSTVRLPHHMCGLLTKWHQAANVLRRELGRPPSEEEIAERLGLSDKRLRAVRKALRVRGSGQLPDAPDGGAPLDQFAAREIFAPLGLRDMMFRPPRRLIPRIAPTGVWRGHPVAGVVNDQNAAILGGVAGHAGLFSTAADLARFAQFMLGQGALRNGPRLLKAETVRTFTAIAVPARRGSSARTLGWEALPTGEEVSSAGTLLGSRSYGHTGWTGTSLWIDPDRGLFVVLLTNRAYAPRSRTSFGVLKEVRGRVADAAARALDER